MRETDLYGPIRDYLVAQGYDVQGEVKGCDIAARKGDDLIVIERNADLTIAASDSSVQVQTAGAGAAGGKAGVGGGLAVGVNASKTLAKLGDGSTTNATGTTAVKADSSETLVTTAVAGAGGGNR